MPIMSRGRLNESKPDRNARVESRDAATHRAEDLASFIRGADPGQPDADPTEKASEANARAVSVRPAVRRDGPALRPFGRCGLIPVEE